MSLENCFEEALRSSDPVEGLRSVALRLRAEGQEQENILAKFETPAHLREANRADDEDIIMDVMDCLVGWCSPQMRIPIEANDAGRDG